MNPTHPWEGASRTAPPHETLLNAAYRAAVTGADAYRGVREAVRLDGETLRVGNRFVPLRRFRELAFLAAGNAANSLALGVNHALGERLTQGFVAGPDPLPAEVPFRSIQVAPGWPGSAAGRAATEGALELAQGLGESDLLLVLLSPGALGSLATAPSTFSGSEWSQWLTHLWEEGASAAEVELLARVVGTGAVGGRLGAIVHGSTVVTLVVERGEGAVLVGGGPTVPVRGEERHKAGQILERLGVTPVVSPLVDPGLSDSPRATGIHPAARLARPVVILSPADALREVGVAFAERKWRTTLAELFLPEAPEPAADRFLARVEELTPDGLARAAATDRKGVAFFAASSLGQPEGLDERPAIARFLDRANRQVRRRELVVAALRTAGGVELGTAAPGQTSRPLEGAPPSGTMGKGPLRMQPGITDVGILLVALLPLPGK